MQSVALVAAVAASTARAASLPSARVSANAAGLDQYSGSSRWSLRAGDSIYYSPPASMLELTSDAKDYYYAIGSEAALTEEMKSRKVGGEGRWHIFHLPEGPEQLQVRTEGSRRESFSSLSQVASGLVLRNAFPRYAAGPQYELPGGSSAEALEVAAASTITPASVEAYLTKVTSLGESGVHTRSSTSTGASHIAAQFLQKEFGDLGLTTCEQKFTTGGKEYSNIVAYIPGRSRDTLTVGAHYDSRPYTGAAPGANDNGSGLSVLLAVAKAFKEAKMTPVRDLFLVGFAAEEQGLYGSKAYVPALLNGSGIPQACQPSGSFIQARRGTRKLRHSGLVLDEIGWRSPKLSQATVNLESAAARSPLLDHLAQANALHNNVETVTTHSDHPFGSDHMSFIRHSLESVLVINGDDEAYPAYHSSSDTMAMVNTTYAAQIGKMVFGGMVREAGLQL